MPSVSSGSPSSSRRLGALQRQLSSSHASRAPVQETRLVCIVGMGFSGMALTYKLRVAGFRDIRSFETGSDVGGTWFWNRYPGCACDVDAYQYSYQFSHELEQEWTWSRRYARQPEILRYANFTADRFDLRSDTLFNTSVVSTAWDETRRMWTIGTDRGDTVHARFLFLANGALSSPATPGIAVTPDFKGECFHTHDWKHDVSMKGKVVGIVGTGSTATQAIPELAREAKHLFVFQRTPAWCAPRKDAPMSASAVAAIKADYAAYRGVKLSESRGNLGGNAGLTDVVKEAAAARPDSISTPTPRQDRPRGNDVARMVDKADNKTKETFREQGGFSVAYAFGGSDDDVQGNSAFGPLGNMAVNQRLRQHLSKKISAVVRDPLVAKKLTPTYPVACKRLCITDDYWPTFNRDNVTLVDLDGRSIATVGSGGPYDSTNKPLFPSAQPLDVLIFATGFNAMTSAAEGQVGIVKGVGGVTLGEKFEGKIETYLGMMTSGFPNCFFMVGPQSASVLANMINAGEQQADWFVRLLQEMNRLGKTRVDVKKDAEAEWARLCRDTTSKTVWGGAGGGCKSWYNKANVAKRDADGNIVELALGMDKAEYATGGGDVLPYTGGQTAYRQLCDEWGTRGLVFA